MNVRSTARMMRDVDCDVDCDVVEIVFVICIEGRRFPKRKRKTVCRLHQNKFSIVAGEVDRK